VDPAGFRHAATAKNSIEGKEVKEISQVKRSEVEILCTAQVNHKAGQQFRSRMPPGFYET
jgi:hypothetical protein